MRRRSTFVVKLAQLVGGWVRGSLDTIRLRISTWLTIAQSDREAHASRPGVRRSSLRMVEYWTLAARSRPARIRSAPPICLAEGIEVDDDSDDGVRVHGR